MRILSRHGRRVGRESVRSFRVLILKTKNHRRAIKLTYYCLCSRYHYAKIHWCGSPVSSLARILILSFSFSLLLIMLRRNLHRTSWTRPRRA